MLDPTHNVKRITFEYRFDDGIALLIFVDKLSLERWANIQFAVVTNHAVGTVVFVTVDYFTDFDDV